MMVETQYYYLMAMLFSIFFPFVFSFDKRVNFSQYFSILPISIGLIAIIFILGDILYTHLGVWGFNEEYHLPYKIIGLPLEEISFFIAVPYACLFIYQSFKTYFPIKNPSILFKFTWGLSVLLLAIGIFHFDKLYTAATCLGSSLILAYISYRKPAITSILLITYLISCIPFFIVNGVLTGMFTPEPIVWYNNAENLHIRMITIPIEDLSYSFNLVVLNFFSFEYFKARKKLAD
jgi:lycopene cyclase domain-containing protein